MITKAYDTHILDEERTRPFLAICSLHPLPFQFYAFERAPFLELWKPGFLACLYSPEERFVSLFELTQSLVEAMDFIFPMVSGIDAQSGISRSLFSKKPSSASFLRPPDTFFQSPL